MKQETFFVMIWICCALQYSLSEETVVFPNKLNNSTLEELNKRNSSTFEQIMDANKRAHISEFLEEGDMKLPIFRNAYGSKWPKSEDGFVHIPYDIEDKFSSHDKATIEAALESFNKHTCIRFSLRTTERRPLLFERRSGCWSRVGFSFFRQILSLGSGCLFRDIILHEVMHAIGFVHEQSRSDRDKYIKVLPYNTFGNSSPFGTKNLVNYDYSSIMHYPPTFFAKNDLLLAFEIIPRRNPEPNVGWRSQLSPYDIEEIKYHYDCEDGKYDRCGRDFTNKTRGRIQSPNYPKNYTSESHCTWNITVSRGKYVRLSLKKIDISESNLCERDAVILHDGKNAGAPVLQKLCGTKSNVAFTSTGNQMFVIFTSVSSAQRKGFQASFAEVSIKGTPAPPIPTTPPLAVKKFVKSFQCNFDKDMCGMTQDKAPFDEIDFMVQRGLTKSRTSGPSADHTSGRGQYIYVKASRYRDEAIIRSTWFRSTKHFCIEFSYHMYNYAIGGLRLFAFEKRRNKQIGEEKLIWEKFGNQSNQWHTLAKDYSPDSDVEYLQFYWAAIIGSFRGAESALDDIEITMKRCMLRPTRPLPTIYRESSCDFETGICKFVQSATDDFDWIRGKRATPRRESGPKKDHTSKNGYHMFIEASNQRKMGDMAQLESPRLTYGTHCLKMWYHMNGNNIGNLTFYKEINGVRYFLKQIQENGENAWKQLTVEMTPDTVEKLTCSERKILPSPNSFMIAIIEASVGNDSKGDIAIDDIEITEGTCAELEFETDTLTSFSCSFETDNHLCGLIQSKNDQFDWTRHKGSTRTKGTGPSIDKTKGTADGHYIYIEASKPRKRNDEAILLTPPVRPGRYCFLFAVHIFGKSIGRLEVAAREGTDGDRQFLWAAATNRRNRWIHINLRYESKNCSKPLQFEIMGRVGAGSSGDIALDDIRVYPETCYPPQTTTSVSATSKSSTSAVTTTTVPPTRTSHSTTTSSSTTTALRTTIRPPPTKTDSWSGMPLCTFETTPSNSSNRINSSDSKAYNFPRRIRNDPFCGWFQITQHDDFDWKLKSGSTPSKKTGPPGDKTTGRGRYLYIEASAPRKPNHRALLQTYSMPPYEYCVHLNYHMYGKNMGKLVIKTLQTLQNGSRRRPKLHEIAGNQGNQWRQAIFDFAPMKKAKDVAFRLEGYVGNGSKSDIAIDDITISPGICNACGSTPTHTYSTSSNQIKRFAAGCIHARLFYVRCCGTDEPQFVYRKVKNCNGNIFRASQLNQFCLIR